MNEVGSSRSINSCWVIENVSTFGNVLFLINSFNILNINRIGEDLCRLGGVYLGITHFKDFKHHLNISTSSQIIILCSKKIRDDRCKKLT
jgi:hypothetical protein